MKTTILFTLSLLLIGSMFAQNPKFITNGNIEFEKSINMHALIKKLNNSVDKMTQLSYEDYKKTKPQFKILKSILTFNDHETLFTPIEDNSVRNAFSKHPLADQNNIVYTDIKASYRVAQKNVFEEFFLLKDSIGTVKWKITDEKRDIAGHTCRRANGLILDSIYVVAFFTNKIPVSGGPESFSGLPGMILSVALPHENISWVATKITAMPAPPDNITPPKKGKPVNNKSYRLTLESAVKSLGASALYYYKALLL